MSEDAGSALALRDEGFAAPYGPAPTRDLVPARTAEVLAPLSGAFDLAESQAIGHAARVAYIAVTVARRLGLDAAARRSTLYAALLHDSGVAVGELPAGVDSEGGHTAAGAWVAARFGLDERIQLAIRCSHERWDGGGRPHGLESRRVPVESLLIGAAHWVCDIAEDSEHPLRARARVQRASLDEVMPIVGPHVAEAVADVVRSDGMWAALWSDGLPALVAGMSGGDGRSSVKTVERVAEAFGAVVDASVREPGRSHRVGLLARALAEAAGMSARECRAVRVAALLVDIGQLGVPRHIMEKPNILSVNEMEQVRQHPRWGAHIIESVPGMQSIAYWVEAHHERPDGRGYPELLEDDEIPLASRILAVADAYWALRAERPYREAFSERQALEIIEGGAGEQHDRDVVALLTLALAECERAGEADSEAAG